MTRYLPLLLVPLLAGTGPVRGDDAAMPPLESRVGRTITVVEAQKPTDRAVITHAWRLLDGTPVMQAKSLTSGNQMTIVENPKATSAVDRIKVHHWSKEGVAPAGCPLMPVAKPAVAVAPPTPKPVMTAPPVMARNERVTTTDGGLVPVMPKKEMPKSVTTVAATAPAAPAALPKVETKPTTTSVVKTEPKPMQTVAAKPVPTAPVAAVPVATAPAAPAIKQAQATMATKTMPAPMAPGMLPNRPLVGGCEVITVTENGKPRQFKVVGTARNRDGMMVQRCEALDNGEIITLNCGACVTNNCVPQAPCPPPSQPIVVKTMPAPQQPVVVKTAPTPPPQAAVPQSAPVRPVPVAPPQVVACEPVKKCEPCPQICDTNCCDTSKHCRKGDDCGREHRMRKSHCWDDNCAMINVPVPGVSLNAAGGFPSAPPPQPLVPSFCTANSSSIRLALNSPLLVPLKCMHQPFTPCMNAQILTGIGMASSDPVEAEAIKNTLYLINVLQTSREWENRQWAADRLQAATLASVKPYVEDCLMSAAQYDRAPHVKVSAIRTLALLKPMRPDLMPMLSQSMGDADPMVQQAAGRAIESLMKGSVQQTGAKK